MFSNMDFSLLLAQSSKCSFILSHIDLLVCPTYFLSHSSHFILYTHPLVRQLIFTPCLHITQFSRPHFQTLNGLLRCSSRFTVLSIFSTTFIFNLLCLQAFFISFNITEFSVTSTNITPSKFSLLYHVGMRILRNCNPNLNWNEGCSHLQHFVHRTQFSGYDHAKRARVITKVLKHYDKKVLKFNETGRMYRSRREQYDERRKTKDEKKATWCYGEKFEGVMFVDVTESLVMLKEMKKACKRNKLKIKVVEKIDSTVKRELQLSNPFKVRKCGRENCVICKQGVKIICRTRGCVYEIKCEECKRKYVGQTSRSMYERMNEHFDDWASRREKSMLIQHSQEFHDNNYFTTKISIIARCFGEPTTRMITEAVHINQLSNEDTLNSKSEWTYTKLPSTTIR